MAISGRKLGLDITLLYSNIPHVSFGLVSPFFWSRRRGALARYKFVLADSVGGALSSLMTDCFSSVMALEVTTTVGTKIKRTPDRSQVKPNKVIVGG
jgi:hypothetical protein